VDPDILWDFEALYEMTDIEKAQVRYQDAQTGAILIQSQVIDPQEERARVADDPDTPYVDLDPMAMPETPQPDQHDDAWTQVFGQLAQTGISPDEPSPSNGWTPALKQLAHSGVRLNDKPNNAGWAPLFGLQLRRCAPDPDGEALCRELAEDAPERQRSHSVFHAMGFGDEPGRDHAGRHRRLCRQRPSWARWG
jgi:hypothetical protein